MTANANYPGKITALYASLSQEDTLDGESNSILLIKVTKRVVSAT